MRAYTTREVAELLGIAPERVRSFARQKFVTPERNGAVIIGSRFKTWSCYEQPMRSSKLSSGTQSLEGIEGGSRSVTNGAPLSSVRVLAEGDRVLVRERNTAWDRSLAKTSSISRWRNLQKR
ncbi:MAG: hypothetical protein CM1200mP36_09070 [Gammaproteobacteria bacterium]|nr:MAG: hypothetical protein CM1200mP36_09070 [Gammaproteobacteria bacterium]